jgi:hypothetical protein
VKKFLVPLAMALFSIGVTQAAVLGTLSFADIGAASANTGNINSSTVFTIGDLFSTVGDGAFAGMPNEIFGPVTFNTAVGTSLTISNAVFGTFASSSITEAVDVPGVVAFYVLGDYTSGTFTAGSGAGGAASFTISYTQTPATTGSISDSSTFSIPPAAPPGTPEPASMVLMGSALVGLAMIRRRRKV